MEGFYLIRDPAEDSLNLPAGSYDVPVAIQDRTFNADNSLSYTVGSRTMGPGSMMGEMGNMGLMGNTLTVNGAVTPCFTSRRTSIGSAS